VALSWAVLFLFAPFFRALMGLAYLSTGYSLLIVGVLHASFNASASTKLDVFDGDWQQIAAVVALLGVIAAVHAGASRLSRAWRASRASGGQPPEPERTLKHQPQPERILKHRPAGMRTNPREE
jgi:hypothetical protein